MNAAKRLWVASALAVGLVGPAAAGSFKTSTGHTVFIGDVGSMSCGQMQAALAQIDATGYRLGSPTPIDAADAPLYEYELQLADAHYRKCSRARAAG